MKMNLKVVQETKSGLNTEFVNTNSGRHISLKQAITQIENGNPNYSGYTVCENKSGTTYIRSNPDGVTNNNIE